MHKFIAQSDVKHIMTSPIKTLMSVLKAWIDITNICGRYLEPSQWGVVRL